MHLWGAKVECNNYILKLFNIRQNLNVSKYYLNATLAPRNMSIMRNCGSNFGIQMYDL